MTTQTAIIEVGVAVVNAIHHPSREQIAVKIAAAICTATSNGWVGERPGDYEEIARRAVAMADALIKELEK